MDQNGFLPVMPRRGMTLQNSCCVFINDEPTKITNNGLVFAGRQRIDRGAQPLYQPIMIKVWPFDHLSPAARAELERRFWVEVSVLWQLSSPRIVEEVDAGEEPGSFFWLALRTVEGGSLADYQRRVNCPLTCYGRIAEWLAQSLEGLADVHDAGIVHGDIKPDNILMDKKYRIRIGDFDLARNLYESHEGHGSGGTIPYVSPELLANHGVGAQSDLFSLGSSFWHLITNELPFGATLDEVRERITQPLPAHGPFMRAPARLRGIVGRLMRASTAERYADANSVLIEIRSAQKTGALPPPESIGTLATQLRL